MTEAQRAVGETSAPSTAAPRIAPGGLRELGFINALVSEVGGLVAKTNAPNLFTTLGKHPRLFRAWLAFSARLMPFGTLPRRETELVILRVAHLRRCEYELRHHVRLAQRVRVSSADLERVKIGASAEGFSPRERAIMHAVTVLHEEQDLDDAGWRELRAHLSERACIELVVLVGQYEMLATTIKALRIELDRPR